MVGDQRFPARRENNHHFMLPPGHSQANDLRTAAVVSASANAVCTPRYLGRPKLAGGCIQRPTVTLSCARSGAQDRAQPRLTELRLRDFH